MDHAEEMAKNPTDNNQEKGIIIILHLLQHLKVRKGKLLMQPQEVLQPWRTYSERSSQRSYTLWLYCTWSVPNSYVWRPWWRSLWNFSKDVIFPKRLGNPEEFAQYAVQIVENQYINGSVLRLDGIRLAWTNQCIQVP